MSHSFQRALKHIPFDPADPKAALAQLPHSAAVFALYGAESHAEPYIGRTPNLRARLERLLQPSPKHPRRLQLAGRVRRIAYRLTGSDFESLLLQFELLEEIYGPKTLDRMHLSAPAFIRFLGSNTYPRITVTNRPSQREADWAYGPFASRAAAERFADEALKLFLLRRCTDDLDPNPSHPGCVYSEMKMCLAPCYQGCTDQRYAEESAAVESFLSTRGDSRLVPLRTQRDQASVDLEFESAAALHAQVQRIEAVRALAPEIVRPMSQLRAVILQASAHPAEVSVFLYEGGIREPMFVVWPGVTAPGSVSEFPVISTDFYRTIAQMAGITKLKGDPRDGVSLVPTLRRNFAPARDAIFWHYPHYSNQGGRPGAAIRLGDWKLLRWYEDNATELYNLRADPGEQKNLADTQAAKARGLDGLLDDWLHALKPEMPVPNPAYDPEQETEGLAPAIQEQLKSGELPTPPKAP